MDFRIEGSSVRFELEVDGVEAEARLDGGEWQLTLSGQGMPTWQHLCQGRVGIDEVIKRAIMLTRIESANAVIRERRRKEEYGDG